MSLALSGAAIAPPSSPAGSTGTEESSFGGQPEAARIFIGGVIAIGFASLFFQPPGLAYSHTGAFVLLLALAAIGAVFKVDLPLSHHGATMSMSFPFEFATLLLLGPHATMVIAATSAWVQCTAASGGHKNPLHRTAFSMAALVLTALIASHVYVLLGGPLVMLAPSHAGFETPAIAAALSYFILNTLIVATAVGFESRQPLRKIWNDHIVWSALNFVVGAGAAAAGAALLVDRNSWAVGLLIVPLYLIHRTYGLYFERVDAEQHRVKQVSDLHLATVEALALAIDAKDQTATAHIRRVQVFAAGLAEEMGMTPAEVQGVRTAALLHDIGKLAVPEHILSKPGPLTQEEFQRMRVHPQVGADIIAPVPFPYPVAPLILNHHERWDGKGYPNGVSGAAIPLGARILAAVDYFDALTSDRPFHKPMTAREALQVVQGEAGQALDPAVVEALVRLMPVLEERARLVDEPTQRVSYGSEGHVAPSPAHDAPAKVFQDIALAHREIYALYEIAQSMGTSLGVADTMALVASKLSNLVPFSSCALFLYEESSDVLRCRFATGMDAEQLQSLSVANGAGLQGWVGRNHRPLVNARPSADLEAAAVQAETSLQSALVCPLIFDGNLIGTLALYHSDPGHFTDDHRRLLDRVAEQAAGVVNNSVLFEQTKRDSLTDNLTGLPNTRFMFVHLTRELARAERLDSEVSLLIMDLDRFKEINDTFGHHVGDRALREVARVLRNGIRPYDICVRYAGDEFVVVLSGCGAAEADQKRRELQQAIEDIPFEVRPGQMVKLGSSFGFSVFPHDGEAYETLLAIADHRMYQDKAARKSRAASLTSTPVEAEKRTSVFAKIPRQPAADRAH